MVENNNSIGNFKKTVEDSTESKRKSCGRFFTLNFFLMWQGQLVSTLGDAVYSIALGFWVLAVTGSTALMGTLMAVSTLPGVLMSPFAGVIIDRFDKKRLMIAMDLIRGACIVLIAIAAIGGFIAIWMVFVAGIILSICGAVFSPGINSAVPDMVPASKLTNANSAISGASTGANMLGSASGGFLYQAFGAPFLFLFNGLSFLFSGISLLFVKIPRVKKKNEQHFFKDMSDGFSFIWHLKGLRYILMMAALTNFFFSGAVVLFLPLFQKTQELGAGRYGIAMACYTCGLMAGYILGSIVHIPARRKYMLFVLSMMLSIVFVIIAANSNFVIILVMLPLSGFFSAIVNVNLVSVCQAATPSEMRGKVMAFINMTCQGLTPFAMVLCGVLGSFLPLRAVITGAFLLEIIVVFPFTLLKPFKLFIKFDYEKENPEVLYKN